MIMHLFSSQYLIVQFEEHRVTLAQGRKTGKSLHIASIVQHPLDMHQIRGSSIFNPTYISKLIQQYAALHRMKKPHIYISFPYIEATPDNPYLLLQHLLCVSKTGFIIDFIGATPLISNVQDAEDQQVALPSDNLLSLLLPKHYHKTGAWLASCLLITVLLCSAIGASQRSLIQNKQMLTQTCDSLIASTHMLQKKVSTVCDLEKGCTALQNHIDTLGTIHSNVNNPFNILVSIAQSTPDCCHLSKIVIKNPKTLHIEGIAHDTQEITSMLKGLAEKHPHAQLALGRIKKIKPSGMQQAQRVQSSYQFSIRGKLTP